MAGAIARTAGRVTSRTRATPLLLLLLLSSVSLSAQVGTEPGAWRPEHRKLADAIGTWTVVGQIGADTIASWRADDRRAAFIRQACRVAIGAGVPSLLKLVIHEERPDGSDDQSFPSQHTALATAAAGWQWSAGVSLSGFIGSSRVGANKHHWKDVAAGAGIGALAQWVCR
jgi:membrane-associated phospholipid phosphatase